MPAKVVMVQTLTKLTVTFTVAVSLRVPSLMV